MLKQSYNNMEFDKIAIFFKKKFRIFILFTFSELPTIGFH